MNLDELPIEVLLALVLLGWAGYFTVIVREMRAKRRENGRSDHDEEQGENDAEADQPAEDDEEDHRIEGHARSVHRGRDR